MNGIQVLQTIKHKLPDVDVIMLTTYDEAIVSISSFTRILCQLMA